MRTFRPWIILPRLGASLLCAGLFYLAWLAVFIPVMKAGSHAWQIVGWLSAPIVTASGFATGIALMNRLFAARGAKIIGPFCWSLPACALGAGLVFPFGPMLIVFGMFTLGTLSMIVREIVLVRRENE